MKGTALLTVFALLCAATVLYLRHPAHQIAAKAAPAEARVTRSGGAGAPAPVPLEGTADRGLPEDPDGAFGRAHPLAVFRDAASNHPAGVDPMIVFALEDFSDEQIAAYNELHVIPFNPAVGKLCESIPDPQLPDQDLAFSRCETLRQQQPHPYTQLADSDLETLAETDPVAAELLGMRVIGDDAARNRWYLRAAALSGKSGPIMALANRRYNATQIYKRNAEGKLVLVEDMDGVRYRAVLETIAAKMGDPRANPDYWRAVLSRQNGSGTEPETVARQALELMEQMARIQRDVTGSTQMWELIHAA
jgi:hypothetical protein